MTEGSREHTIDIRAALKAQYRAALWMMEQAIRRCPDTLWDASGPNECPFWRVVFHGLFFTHFYLQKDHKSMRRWAKHRGQLQDTTGPAAEPDEVYTKGEMLEYMAFCREMIDGAVDAMDLASADCGFPWYKLGKLEHQINNIRHIQHHFAQLAARVNAATGQDVDWTMGSV